jgi:uncharacterized Zn ribbon protein
MSCTHKNLKTKKYVGSEETYTYCPDCWDQWEPNQPGKQALLERAIETDPGEIGEGELS